MRADAVCTSDTECVDATGDPEATCSTDLAFAANSQVLLTQPALWITWCP